MKKVFKISLFVLVFAILVFGVNYVFYEPTEINFLVASKLYKAPANSYFRDENFYKAVVDAYNEQNNANVGYTTSLSDEQLKTIKSLNLSCNDYVWVCEDEGCQMCSPYSSVYDLDGLNKLTSLEKLSILGYSINQLDVSLLTELKELHVGLPLNNLDLSKNINLERLIISGALMNSINLDNNINLEFLYIVGDALSTLDVSRNINLERLVIACSALTSINLENNINLKSLDIAYTGISNLDISKNIKLDSLHIGNTLISEIDVSKNIELLDLQLFNNNELSSINVEKNLKLMGLMLDYNKYDDEGATLYSSKLKEIDVSKNLNLEYLSLNGQLGITEIDLSNNTKLVDLDLSNTGVEDVDLTNLIYLESFDIGAEDGSTSIKNLDFSKNVNLGFLTIFGGEFDKLDLSNVLELKQLHLHDMKVEEIDFNGEGLAHAGFSNMDLRMLNLSELTNLYSLNLYNVVLDSLDLSNMTNLNYLDIGEMTLGELDLSHNINLETISFYETVFGEELYVYKNDRVALNNKVKFPETYGSIGIEWESEDVNKATVDQDGLVTTKETGVVNIVGNVLQYDEYLEEYTEFYTVNNKINIVEITSNKYVIDEDDNTITLTDGDVDIIKSNINVVDGVTIDVELDSLKLYVKHNDMTLKIFNIVQKKIDSDDEIQVDDEKGILTNIDYNTNASDIFDKFNTYGNVVITNKDNKVLSGNDKVGTGSKVIIKSDSTIYEYTIVIYGDIDGDGILKLSDVMKMANYIYINKNGLSGPFKLAVDYDKNDKHNLQDIMKLANKLYSGGN